MLAGHIFRLQFRILEEIFLDLVAQKEMEAEPAVDAAA
jgi:hypothetical protein